MGSVVEFPSKENLEDRISKLKIEDAMYVSLCKLDEDMIPLFPHEDQVWWGVIAFWEYQKMDEKQSVMDVAIQAAFKHRHHALEFAMRHASKVTDDMEQDLIIRMRMELCGIEWVPDDDPSGGNNVG
jgi:predicted class III extradiol MEMO1 family dioxygenase